MTTPAPTVRVRDSGDHLRRTRALDGVSFDLVPGGDRAARSQRGGQDHPAARPRHGVGARFRVCPGARPGPWRSDQRLDLRGRLGYMPQEPRFHARFTAFEFDYVAILKELHQRRARHQEVRRVLELVGLGAVRGKQIKALSGGMRRRVALVRRCSATRTCWCSTSPPGRPRPRAAAALP